MVMAAETGSATGQAMQTVRFCARCGDAIMRRRRTARQNADLCTTCDQRDRRAEYFRSYYENHKDRILDKNRRWAKDNKSRIVELRQARRERDTSVQPVTRACVDCSEPVTRAARCRKCYIRFRYKSDPAYRERRLATTRRWLEKRQSQGPLLREPSATALANAN